MSFIEISVKASREGLKDFKFSELLFDSYRQTFSFFLILMNFNVFISFFQDCVFNKDADSTVLKVEYNGDIRIAGCLDCCSRWFFTFNGVECRKPLAIDGLMHIAQNHGRTDTNIHRVGQIGGYCEGIPKGTVRVGINVGSCVGKKAAEAYTGWNSVARIMIEEVPPSQ